MLTQNIFKDRQVTVATGVEHLVVGVEEDQIEKPLTHVDTKRGVDHRIILSQYNLSAVDAEGSRT
jgi:hypothetical protein